MAAAFIRWKTFHQAPGEYRPPGAAFVCDPRLSRLVGTLALVQGRFQAKDDLTGHRAQRTAGRLRDLPMQLFTAADAKLAAGCRFLSGHLSSPRSVNTMRIFAWPCPF